MANGNGQFDYPDPGWSTGGMRKVGEAMETGAKVQRKRFGEGLPPGTEFHKSFDTLPDDWTHIERVDGGLHVRRSLEKASPKELRQRGF